MASWGFLTNHARALLCIAHDPGTRLRDIAARPDITERSAHGIITDLTAAGYLVKQKDGRRNRYQIQGLPEERMAAGLVLIHGRAHGARIAAQPAEAVGARCKPPGQMPGLAAANVAAVTR